MWTRRTWPTWRLSTNPIQEYEAAAATAKTILDAAAEQAKKADVPFKVMHVKDRYPPKGSWKPRRIPAAI